MLIFINILADLLQVVHTASWLHMNKKQKQENGCLFVHCVCMLYSTSFGNVLIKQLQLWFLLLLSFTFLAVLFAVWRLLSFLLCQFLEHIYRPTIAPFMDACPHWSQLLSVSVREYYQSFFILNNKHESTVYNLSILGNKAHFAAFKYILYSCCFFLNMSFTFILQKYVGCQRQLWCPVFIEYVEASVDCSLTSFSVGNRPKANNMHCITQSCGKLSPGDSGKSVCACFVFMNVWSLIPCLRASL